MRIVCAHSTQFRTVLFFISCFVFFLVFMVIFIYACADFNCFHWLKAFLYLSRFSVRSCCINERIYHSFILFNLKCADRCTNISNNPIEMVEIFLISIRTLCALVITKHGFEVHLRSVKTKLGFLTFKCEWKRKINTHLQNHNAENVAVAAID